LDSTSVTNADSSSGAYCTAAILHFVQDDSLIGSGLVRAEWLAISLASVAVAAHAFEFVFAYFAAQRIAVDSQLFRATGLIALAAFQNTANKLFLEFTDSFFEQDSSLDHHSDQRFELIFHDCTLRSGASE
jgi:hypothetical protein